MTLPPSLDPSLTDQLAGTADAPAPAAAAHTGQPPAAAAGLKQRLRSVAANQFNRAVHRLRDASAGRELVEPFVVERTAPLADELTALRDRVSTLSAEVARLVAEIGRAAADRNRQQAVTDELAATLTAALGRIAGLERRRDDSAGPAADVGEAGADGVEAG